MADAPHHFVDPSKLFSHESSSHDVLLLIKKYLLACGLQSTATTLRNECELFRKTSRQARRAIRDYVAEGDWEALRDLAKVGGPVRHKLIRTFTYLVNRQEFFELVHNHENYQAFAHLVRKLKPFERECRIFGNDFRDLSYLATCRSVTDSPQFRSWEGVALSRQRLARELERLVYRTALMAGVASDDDAAASAAAAGAAGATGEDEDEPSFLDLLDDDDDDEDDDYQIEGGGGGGAGWGEVEDKEEDAILAMRTATGETSAPSNVVREPPPARLVRLLQQAYAYQIETKQRRALSTPAPPTPAPSSSSSSYRVSSLLEDFAFPTLPTSSHCRSLVGHSSSVKCVEFAPLARLAISGSGDCSVIFWDLASSSSQQQQRRTVGLGHTARVWDVCANADGSRAASVSADSSLRIWDLARLANEGGGGGDGSSEEDATTTATTTIHSLSTIDTQHDSDIYSVRFHPHARSHVLTCGHDQTCKLVDVETNQVVKTFRGHTGSVVQAVFNPVGNLVCTGGKDSTVKFFDVVSGVCVKTLPQQLGEVASVQFAQAGGDKLLVATKDSTHRLWDVRQTGGGPQAKFKGHVNSSKSFIRAQFGATDSIVLSGSENGAVYVWDAVNGEVLERLLGHRGSVFRANWSRELDAMATCSEDGTVRIWNSSASSSATI